MLSVLLAPMDDAKACAGLARMLPMFNGFPDAAFTPASCEHIASQCKRVPSYGELREKLGAWWNQHMPPPPPAPIPRIAFADDPERQAANRASWDDAAAIRNSVRLVLSSPLHQMRLGKLLARCVAVAAPQHMHHVPPEWHLTDEERLEAHA